MTEYHREYFIKTELVFEYIDSNKTISFNKFHKDIETKTLNENKLDDESIRYGWATDEHIKSELKKEMERIISDNTYKELLYENGKWLDSSYDKKYKKEASKCPKNCKLLKAYINYEAWENN